MGRPEVDIDAEQVMKLASMGAKNTEIADFFGVSADTIERRFAGDLTKGRANLKINLRRWQLKAAEKGNPAILIWLGKQMLDQKDRHEIVGDPSKEIVVKLAYDRSKVDE